MATHSSILAEINKLRTLELSKHVYVHVTKVF